ncbi:orexin receptor type 2-like [Anneissia japonica]|uniref:orexin receptor type 2-like n=1 Tax=Anneissia japonica TaxID=1529436 RepID=UPI0014255A81|nr:orexin receptor type 2-like [Anneissia japonica]
MTDYSYSYMSSFNTSYVYTDDVFDDIRGIIHPQPFEWVIVSTYVVIFLFSLIGNSLVCLTVLQNEHMRTVTNMYIVNLSIADILVTIVCIPMTVTHEISQTWFFGPTACKLIYYFQIVFIGVSIFTLTFIALDRYLAICCPFKYKINRCRTVVLIAIAWLLSFIIALPLYFVQTYEEHFLKEHHNKELLSKCQENWGNETVQRLYHVGLAMALYVIPLTVISLAYTKVCSTLWSGIPTEEKTCGKVPDKKVRSSSTSAAQTQTENRKKVARMLIVVVVLFALCYFMTHLLNLLSVFGFFDKYTKHNDDNKMVPWFMVSHWFVYFNSAVNPIIYNFLSAKFRQEFKAICLCCCRRAKKRQETISETGRSTEYVGMSCKKASYDNGRRTQALLSSVQTV